MKKLDKNPLITRKDVKPSHSGLRVDGIFNCGACMYKGETLLLCRVSESVACENGSIVKIPFAIPCNEGIDVMEIKKDEHPDWDFSDPRSISINSCSGPYIKYLTSLSHLRLARSKDGINFKVDDKPFIWPETSRESWGAEDPRVTQIEDKYYICYTAVSEKGPAVGLIETDDFVKYQRLGIIFAPDNKDTVIFPRKINGMYYALNRPSCQSFSSLNMWISESPDLIHWGNQKPFCATSENGWESGRIGAGAVPFETEKGFIEIYHAADRFNRYCLGAMLLDKDHPERIIAKTEKPIMEPDKSYETCGFFGDTVFSCGCCFDGKNIALYYGAADDKICRADFTADEIYAALK